MITALNLETICHHAIITHYWLYSPSPFPPISPHPFSSGNQPSVCSLFLWDCLGFVLFVHLLWFFDSCWLHHEIAGGWVKRIKRNNMNKSLLLSLSLWLLGVLFILLESEIVHFSWRRNLKLKSLWLGIMVVVCNIFLLFNSQVFFFLLIYLSDICIYEKCCLNLYLHRIYLQSNYLLKFKDRFLILFQWVECLSFRFCFAFSCFVCFCLF